MKAIYYPTLICDGCKFALEVKTEWFKSDGEYKAYLLHPKNPDCGFSGKKFKAPDIELEELD